MNALYLAYAILAINFFLLSKKWDTKWLQQGNYLFLALVTTITLMQDLREVVIAHFSGYLVEMLAYIESHTGKSVFLHLLLFSLIPAVGIINYARCIRQQARIQVIIWLVVVCSLLYAGYQQQSLHTYIPFYNSTFTVEPGWHTVISASLGIAHLLIAFAIGTGITALVARWLKSRHLKRQIGAK